MLNQSPLKASTSSDPVRTTGLKIKMTPKVLWININGNQFVYFLAKISVREGPDVDQPGNKEALRLITCD